LSALKTVLTDSATSAPIPSPNWEAPTSWYFAIHSYS
jgi:hypothetical protein